VGDYLGLGHQLGKQSVKSSLDLALDRRPLMMMMMMMMMLTMMMLMVCMSRLAGVSARKSVNRRRRWLTAKWPVTWARLDLVLGPDQTKTDHTGSSQLAIDIV